MTILGAAIGIAVYVSITTITGNLQRETQEVMAGYDSDITVQGRTAATPLASRIMQKDYEELKALSGNNITPIVVGSLREGWNPYALIFGTTEKLISRLGLVEGKPLAGSGGEAMIGLLLAQRLGLGVGNMVPLGGKNYRIAGIFSVGSRLLDGAVVTDLREAQGLLGREGQVSLLMVRVKNKEETKRLVEEINTRFPRLKALPTADFVGNIRLFKTFETFARAVSSISFFAACLVVANTLLMAVSERTRELGILMAIGWRPIRIFRMLLAESFALCLSGALAGNGLALLILHELNRSRDVGFGWIPVSISPRTVCASLLISLVIALIAIVWPALVIYRLSPAEALRHE